LHGIAPFVSSHYRNHSTVYRAVCQQVSAYGLHSGHNAFGDADEFLTECCVLGCVGIRAFCRDAIWNCMSECGSV